MYNKQHYENASEEVRIIYDEIIESIGNEGLLDYFKVLGRYNPTVLSVTWNSFKSIMLRGDLPRSLKELVFIAISIEKKCNYCTSVHTAMCKMLSINESTLNKVINQSQDISPRKLQLSINFALKVALHSEQITKEDHEILLDAGITKSEIFELMSLASLVNYSNTLSQSMMIDVDKDVVSFLGK